MSLRLACVIDACVHLFQQICVGVWKVLLVVQALLEDVHFFATGLCRRSIIIHQLKLFDDLRSMFDHNLDLLRLERSLVLED